MCRVDVLIEQEIAERIGDQTIVDNLETLQHVRVMADDDICARLDRAVKDRLLA